MQASVWPDRIRTPPSRATSGKTIGGAHIAIGERAHRVVAFLGGNAGGETVTHVDRNGKSCAERRIVMRHHRVEMQPPRFFGGQRRADDAGGIADDERHLFRRAQGGGDEQVAFILAVIVVHDDHDLAPRKGGNCRFNSLMTVGHF
jgi:hypothetical protein